MNTLSKLRWGILGAARINQQLMPAIANAKNSELVAIASRRQGAAAETLAAYAPQLNDVTLYDSPEALLADNNIDAVYIPLANHEHASWVLKAIEQGKHVLCEKPMALNVADIEAIEVAAQQQQVSVMEGFMYRFHPQHARIQAIIDSGDIGEVRSVRSCFSFMLQPARLYRLDQPLNNGGGAMWDIGCYAIHAARLPFGEATPLGVTAMINTLDNGADSGGSGIIDYGEGKYAQFDYSFSRARRAEYEIIGTKGGIKCHNVWAKQDEQPVISWWTESGEPKQENLALANHFILEVEHFADCVLQQQAPKLLLSDTKMNCQLINAAIESARAGGSGFNRESY